MHHFAKRENPIIVIIALVIIFGVIVGSFLSVCIYRIPYGRYPTEVIFNPQEGEEATPERIEDPNPENLMSPWYPPRSFCPHCDKDLLWWHNIPVLSWLLLRGKCHFCKAPISVRYPCVELLSALCAVLSYITFGGFTLSAVIVYLFCAALIVISFIDYDYYIIPDVISLPATTVGIVLAIANQFLHVLPPPFCQSALECVFGLLAGAGFLWLVATVFMLLFRKEGMGMGDVKLMAMVGAFFGPAAALVSIFLGSFLGSILGISLMLILWRRVRQLPFGPYLALGAVLFLFMTEDQLLQLQSLLTKVAGG